MIAIMLAATACMPRTSPAEDSRLPAVPALAPLGIPLRGHDGQVWSVAFSPAGQVLASGGDDNAVILWDVSDPTRPARLGEPLAGHTNWVVSLAFDAGGAVLASAGWDGTVLLWDVSDPAAPAVLGTPLTGHSGSVYAVAFSPSAAVLASGGTDGNIVLWDVTDPRAAVRIGQPLTGHKAHVNALAFSPDGSVLVSGSCAKPKATRGMGYTCGQGEIRFWDVSDPVAPRSIGEAIKAHDGEVISLAFAPEGGLLASVGGGSVELWEAGKPRPPRQPVAALPVRSANVQAVAFSPAGDVLATGGCVQEEDEGACLSGDTTLWNVKDPLRPQKLAVLTPGHSDWVTSVAFGPDGRTLASGSWDGSILLWGVSVQ